MMPNDQQKWPRPVRVGVSVGLAVLCWVAIAAVVWAVMA